MRSYNIPQILASITGYKGIPFPGGFIPGADSHSYRVEGYDATPGQPQPQQSINGTPLRKMDHRGIWYFMPVMIRHKEGTLELQNAVIRITGQKNIVETPLVGRKGSVKELVSIDDYTVSITAFVKSDDGTYPEEQIRRIRELYNQNASVEIISVLTDLVLDQDDRIVITDIEYPPTPGVEDGQAVRIECRTDHDFDLILE